MWIAEPTYDDSTTHKSLLEAVEYWIGNDQSVKFSQSIDGVRQPSSVAYDGLTGCLCCTQDHAREIAKYKPFPPNAFSTGSNPWELPILENN